MYKLLVKPLGSTEFCVADFGADTPSITFEANDIAELQNRQANYTQRLTLPLTMNNRRIFDHVDALQYKGKQPYTTLEARLYYNNAELIGKGGLLKVLQLNETTIEVTVLGGIKNVFEELANIDLTNTNLLGVPTMPQNDEDEAWAQNADDNPYVFASYRVSANKTNADSIDGYIQNYMPLARLFHTTDDGFVGVIPTLIQSLGYTIQTNISTSELNDMCLSLVEPKNTNDGSVAKYVMLSANTNIQQSYIDSLPEARFEDDPLYRCLVNYDVTSQIHRSVNSVRVDMSTQNTTSNPIDFGVRVCWEGSVDGNYSAFDMQNFDDNAPNWDEYGWQLVGSERRKSFIAYADGNVYESQLDGSFELVQDNEFSKKLLDIEDNVKVCIRYRSNFQDLNLSTKLEWRSDVDTDNAVAGLPINVAKSLGWNNGSDALKAFCQMFALCVDVDYANKIVYLNSLDELARNKNNAIDWTYKLTGDIKRTYTYGSYAQQNNILFNENDATGYQDKGTITIADENLTKTKDLFTIALESGEGDKIEQLNDTETEFKKSKKPHLVRIDEDGDEQEDRAYVYSHVGCDYLVSSYYNFIGGVLNDALVVSAMFNLTEHDVAHIDFMTPIYLRQFGRYFYLNSVSNFQVGQLTEVTMVAI